MLFIWNQYLFNTWSFCFPAIDTETEGCDSSISTCLPDGRYAPVQCKGNQFTGRYEYRYVFCNYDQQQIMNGCMIFTVQCRWSKSVVYQSSS